ncbi:helix-turn-helix domain-containing protein [Amycolatopsis sp. BJA-103]|uniref:helix-turn-helix domain-containing protein n=1 Tax=unclassified Amycolatopsis TaxID=2618356 RepID=UPI000CA0DEAE|nr:helix-turn-helix domain-containing protein [Amycolatopsis sp. BJA-103]AUI64392.1 transcriptional regulator [Amycolatopsis sp. BJA-103]PNE17875.1 transcriptional regulator [Amycolatopsis sp. BJA-103]
MMTEPRATTLTERIDRLFQVVRRPNGEQYSHEEVARACRESTGESFSAAYLWQLRTGRRDNPTKRHLEALAGFFQVPPAYFFDDEQGRALAEEVELLGALRNVAVRNLALRAVTLSEEGLGTVADIVEAIKLRESRRNQGE